jgi:hypothetical protein
MNGKDISTLVDIKNSLDTPAVQEAVRDAVIAKPAKEVESSLMKLLQYRAAKLQDSIEFEELVKASIEARISEASFPQLLQLLEAIQAGNSRATEGLFAPFLNNPELAAGLTGGRTSKAADAAGEAAYAATDDKRVLQGMVALTQLLDLLKAKQSMAGAVTAEVVSSQDQTDDSSS